MKENKNCTPCIKTSIGGQALMEGIMMRGPKKAAMAVRNPDGEIVLENVEIKVKKRPAFTKWPFIRGVFSFVDSMSMGYKCLMRSAEISGLEEAEAELAREKEEKKRAKAEKKALKEGKTLDLPVETVEEKTVDTASVGEFFEETAVAADETSTVDTLDTTVISDKEEKANDKNDKNESSAIMGLVTVLSLVLGFALAIGLFVLLPNVICALVGITPDSPVLYAVISGGIKVVILIAYMFLVSLMKDIKRTFMYHGAEHKTIFCYEQGKELTVENVREQSRFHPRCGTSFLFLTVIVSIVIMIAVGFLLQAVLPSEITDNRWLYMLIRTGVALLLVPFMAGVGFELIKLAGRKDNAFTRIISAPGLWMQRITTKEPDDSMIECAIVAMKEVIPDDGSDKI